MELEVARSAHGVARRRLVLVCGMADLNCENALLSSIGTVRSQETS